VDLYLLNWHQHSYNATGKTEIAGLKWNRATKNQQHKGRSQMPLEKKYSFCLPLSVTLLINSILSENVTINATNWAGEVTLLTWFQCQGHFFKTSSCSLSDFLVIDSGLLNSLRIYMTNCSFFVFMAYHSINCCTCECSYWHTWKNDLTLLYYYKSMV
jgi:hypothetical protein